MVPRQAENPQMIMNRNLAGFITSDATLDEVSIIQFTKSISLLFSYVEAY
jgi:hypothetical protein